MSNDAAMNMIDRGRARWRSRRGMLELDLILVAFVEREFDLLGAADQARYIELLTLDDFEIWDWLQGVAEPPAQYAELITRIRPATA